MGSERIVWIIKGQEGFGISRAILSVALGFRKRNIVLDFISFSEGRMPTLLMQNGFTVYVIGVSSRRIFDGRLITMVKNIGVLVRDSVRLAKVVGKAIDTGGYRKLLYKTADLTSVIALLRVKNLEKYWIMPNEIGKYPLSINKRIYQLACTIGRINVIANSNYTAKTIMGWGIKPKILHLGVDPERFNPDADTADKDIFEDEDIVFGVFARMTRDKAQDIVLNAFLHLVDQHGHLSLKLLLIGADRSSSFFTECAALIDRLGLSNKVCILESVEDIQNYYPLVDVVINSRRNAEPFGLTIVEAMLMRKPVIAYKLGGPSETILDGITGWLIEEATIEGYYEAMNRAISVRENWTKMGHQGRDRALNYFTAERMVTNLFQIIK